MTPSMHSVPILFFTTCLVLFRRISYEIKLLQIEVIKINTVDTRMYISLGTKKCRFTNVTKRVNTLIWV